MHNLRDQMNMETNKLRNEEIQKTTVEERLGKALHDLNHMKNEHMTVNYKNIDWISQKSNFIVLFSVIGIFGSNVTCIGME